LHACIKKLSQADTLTLRFSRGVSAVILMVYVLYLHFLIKSPAQLSTSVDKDTEAQHLPMGHSIILQDNTAPPLELPTLPALPKVNKAVRAEQRPKPIHTPSGGISYMPEDLVEDDSISKRASIILLLISAGFISTCAEFLVSSIEHVVANARLTEAFLGLIILPLLGNTAELGTAVTVAIKNKIDLAINVTVGSAIQITLFMAPAMVIMGWITGKAMTLEFDMFQTVALIITLVMVNLILLGGRCSALSGLLLFACYIIIGYVISPWFFSTGNVIWLTLDPACRIGAYDFPNQHKSESN
jgi:Ca2+/H+ antiporter